MAWSQEDIALLANFGGGLPDYPRSGNLTPSCNVFGLEPRFCGASKRSSRGRSPLAHVFLPVALFAKHLAASVAMMGDVVRTLGNHHPHHSRHACTVLYPQSPLSTIIG